AIGSQRPRQLAARERVINTSDQETQPGSSSTAVVARCVPSMVVGRKTQRNLHGKLAHQAFANDLRLVPTAIAPGECLALLIVFLHDVVIHERQPDPPAEMHAE